MVKLSEVLLWSGELQAGKEVGWNRWVAQGGIVLVCVSRSASPSGCVPVLTQGFICWVKYSSGKACLVGGGELRFSKTLSRGDIGVQLFELGQRGGGG